MLYSNFIVYVSGLNIYRNKAGYKIVNVSRNTIKKDKREGEFIFNIYDLHEHEHEC
jgi:hypothetical protein